MLRSLRESRLASRLLLGLTLWNLALAGVFFLLLLTWRFRYVRGPLFELFDMRSEESLTTWTSVLLMAALGIAAIVAGVREKRLGWKLSGAFFLFLSLDDATRFHERIGYIVEARVGKEEIPVYGWLLALVPVFVVLGGLAFVQVWRDLGRRGRPFVIAAFSAWGLALALEVIEKRLFQNGLTYRGFPAYRYTQMVEEFCELMAPLLLLVCVLAHLERLGRSRTVDLPDLRPGTLTTKDAG